MYCNGWHTKKEEYRGYEIIHFIKPKGNDTEYYYIAKKEERVSQLCLKTIKAAKNVIDTFIRSHTYPVYR